MRKLFRLITVISISLAQIFSFKDSVAQTGMAVTKEEFIEHAETDKVLELSLAECIALALTSNSEIKIKRVGPLIANEAIRKAKGAFEPTLKADLGYDETKEPSVSPTLTGNTEDTSRTKNLDMGIEGKLISNTTYDINWENSTYSSNSRLQRFFPDYESALSATVTQPLAKDFIGMGQDQGNIVIAKNNKNSSDYAVVNEAIAVVSNVESIYYDYIHHLEQYKVGVISLRSAQALLDVVKKRYDKGLASSVELFEAEAGVARREERLLYFEKELKYSVDKLKLVTNLVDDPDLWNVAVFAEDKPRFEIRKPNLVESIKEAFQSRLDYKIAQIDLKNKDVNIKVAQNKLLPTVDLVGTYEANGLADKYSSAIDQVKDSTYSSWSAGLNIKVPFGFAKELSDYNTSKFEKQKALIAFARLEQNIVLEVRDATRNVDIFYRNVKAAEKSLEAQKKTYDAAKARFSQGLLSTKDMFDYQRDFDTENLNYVLALTEYNKSLVAYQKAKGTTLSEHNVYFE